MERYMDHFREEHLDVLAEKTLFQGLTRDEIRAFIFYSKPLYVKLYEGQRLRLENEYSRMVGLVVSGLTHIYTVGYEGNRTLVRSMEEGDVGGLLYTMLDYQNFVLELVAYRDASVIMIEVDAIYDTEGMVVSAQQKILVNMIKSQRRTFFELTEHLAILSRRTVRDKILRFLRYYAQITGGTEFTLPFSREGLADYLAVDRASLSRSLSMLRDEGVIAFHRSDFRILDADKLND